MARDAELRARITAKDDASKVIDKVADAAADLEDHPVEVEVSGNVREPSPPSTRSPPRRSDRGGRGGVGPGARPGAGGEGRPRGDRRRPAATWVCRSTRSRATPTSWAPRCGNCPTPTSAASSARWGQPAASSTRSGRPRLARSRPWPTWWATSSQSLGQLAGVTGRLGVGVGQIGEAFADAAFDGDKFGNIVKNVALVAGPMAALGLATAVFTKAMETAAKTKAFETAKIESYVEALKEGKTVTEAFNEAVEKTGKLEFDTNDLPFAGLEDLLPTLVKARVFTDEFETMVAGYGTTLGDVADQEIHFRSVLRDRGVAEEDAIRIAHAARQEYEARASPPRRRASRKRS